MGSLNVDEYYQPIPRRVIKEPKVRESRVDLPSFHGKEDVDAYLDWEMKVEKIFTCHQVGEERKVPLATLAFQGQAMYWWTALNDLRSAMRRRHIPSYYSMELMGKLQRLQQKNMSVEKYRQRMELYLMRAGIREEERLTIARFLSGLNFDIRDRVELLPYRDLDDLVQLWRGHIASQCPTKKTMILRGKDIYSEDSSSSSSSSESEDQTSDHEIEKLYHVDGDLLMVKRLLGSQRCPTSLSQRENIFHTRCLVSKRSCSLIVDSGSCSNCCSTRLVIEVVSGQIKQLNAVLGSCPRSSPKDHFSLSKA
uniref:Retrotransposon gag domain-containing protein n=1 Tax=Cajanus cajan TaxID=3821 RepID=A0A151UIA1_CAJCA